MDLRAQRTRRSIINAFIELRAVKPLEKITVKELAEKALINKATFYQHFEDIYQLSETLEEEAIETVFQNIAHINSLLENPTEGCLELFDALSNRGTLVNILFSGSRQPLLLSGLETKIKAAIFATHPEYQGNLEKEVLLTVLLRGCSGAFSAYSHADQQQLIDVLARISECLAKAFF